jgi:hypothetical protein
MNFRKGIFLLYFIMISLDIYGQINNHYWLVCTFKVLEMPLLAYYYYQTRISKIEILDKLLLLSLAISFLGIWVSFLFNRDAALIDLVTIIYIIEGQINLFILSKLNRYLGTNNKNDLWRISVALSVAVGFIYLLFPLFTTLTQVLVLVVMIQLSLMSIYGLFKKGIHISISLSIITIILSNILSVSGVFLKAIPYDYFWIMGLVYISKLLFVEGVHQTLKSLNS